MAALAASGYSNRAIAEELFITVSTVEQHLTRVYRKLDIKNRRQLPGLLRSNPDRHRPGPCPHTTAATGRTGSELTGSDAHR